VAGGSAASVGSASGSPALALACLIAPHSPEISFADKRAVAIFFDGRTNVHARKKISVIADKIVCRYSDVDITSRSCDLTFRDTVRKLDGREANELFATAALAGVKSEGSAGHINQNLTKLKCTLDPVAIRNKAGGGAECSYEQ
jgi:hypothetical protein